MLKKGQKFGVYKINDIYISNKDYGHYLSEDPFFKSPVILNVYCIDKLSPEQQSCLKQKLDDLFLLEHPAIVSAVDSGYEQGCFYYTTQYYSSRSFKQRAVDGTSGVEVKNIFLTLAQALAYAESYGHFHGTIEAEDIVFAEDGEVQLLNFGLCQSLAFSRSKTSQAEEAKAETFSSLGRHMLKLFSEQKQEEDSPLSPVIDRCLNRGEGQYQSFKSLVDELIQLDFINDQVEPAKGESGKAIQKSGDVKISEEQRLQILPQVRELISERNEVQADYETLKLEYEKKRQELNDAVQETESLAQRLHLVTRFDRGQERKRMVVSALTGVFIGLFLTTIFVSDLKIQDNSKDIEISVDQQMDTHVVSEPLINRSEMSPESQERLLPTQAVPVAATRAEMPIEGIATIQREKSGWSVFDTGLNIFNVSNAHAQKVKNSDVVFDTATQEVIAQTLTDWSESWARQEIEKYLSCYSDRFQPVGGMDFQKWQEIRRARLKRPDWIEVGVTEVKISPVSRRHARVFFRQHYHSDRFEDDTYKEVVLVDEGGDWRIIEEKSVKL